MFAKNMFNLLKSEGVVVGIMNVSFKKELLPFI
jgi:hypothetical protein